MSQVKNFINWNHPGTAFITGASSGFGAVFARELASQKFNVVLVARRKERLDKLASELEEQYDIQAQVLTADLSKLGDIEHLYDEITKLDDIDVLINNAGFGTSGYFDNTPFGPQRDMLFVHNVAPVYFCRAALPIMIKRGRGVIINLSSVLAFYQTPQNLMYTATKVFLKEFTETLSLELEDTGVKVQALCPGFAHTEFHDTEYFKEFDKNAIPENLWMNAEDVVKLSLEAVPKGKVVFIPGEPYQAFVKLITDPKLGRRTLRSMRNAAKLPRH